MFDPPADAEADAPEAEVDVVEESVEPPLIESESLVEDVSIDGMCGVY